MLQTDRRRAWRIAAPGRAELSDARALRVCDPKGRESAEHAADNAAAANLTLSDSEIAALDKAFPRGPKPRGLPML